MTSTDELELIARYFTWRLECTPLAGEDRARVQQLLERWRRLVAH